MKTVLRWKLIFADMLCFAGLSTLCMAQVTEVRGTIGPGARYMFLVPDNWNNEVIYFAHGHVAPDMPSDPLAPNEFYDAFVANGYAVAASSFSEYGWAVEEGIRQTHQLRGLFVSRFGEPDHSYLMGSSMGGLIALALAEKYGEQYDGAFLMSAPLGGTDMGLGFMFHTRAVFDFYYPGVLPGDALYLPEDVDLVQIFFVDLPAAIFANPMGIVYMSGIEQLGIAAGDPLELMDTIFLRLIMNILEVNDALYRTHDHIFFDKSDMVYFGFFNYDDLNAGVDRFASTPDAENYFARYYEPTGELEIPVLTLAHGRDPIVPMQSHDVTFRAVAEAAGSGDLLVQQYAETYGHCAFSMDQILNAFDALVVWAKGGQKPSDGIIP